MAEPASPATFFIRTFGCQMNEHDSGRMAQQLVAAGLEPAPEPGRADLIIVNSCSVRAKPEHKALSEAGRYKAHRRRRNARIVLAGCVAQQEGARLLERAPWLDGVLGPDAAGRMHELIEAVRRGALPVLWVEQHSRGDPRFVPLGPSCGRQVSAPVTIMKGCDNFCSYCVVPLVRGREVSRPQSEILSEVEELAERGCREVVLLGQNVNSYRGIRGGDFPALLEALDRQGAARRIRFTTSHPKDASDRLVQAVAGLDRVCEHIHLALQAGSDRILHAMRRGYRAADFIERVLAFRRAVPGISVTTDIIVGFPGETEDDFRATLAAVEAAAFDAAYSFKYSPRPGTAASRLPDDVPPGVKADRLARLQRRLRELEAASLDRLVGSTQEVLVERRSLRDPEARTGRTRCNRVVNFRADPPPAPGDRVAVSVQETRGHTLWGRI